jgi:quercetin dioxygenase-like cupin family protein
LSPRTVALLGNCNVTVVNVMVVNVMVGKVKGEFLWHKHDDADDFFLVRKEQLDIQLRGRTVCLGPGQMFIVARNVEHRPVVWSIVAPEDVHLLIEPSGTPNRGDVKTAAPRKMA